MKRKIIAFLTAITAIAASLSLSFNVYAEDDILIEDIEEVTEEATEATDKGISEEEFNERSEALQAQIDEVFKLLEENGYSIDGINGNVDGISSEISDLQMSMSELYSMIGALRNSRSNSTPNTSYSAVTTPKQEPVVTTPPLHAEPDVEPNGYLIESVKKLPTERDFISVTTRDGHVFYLVIDYEDNNKRVYFLNTVDTADLEHLLSNGGTTAVAVNEKAEIKAVTTAAESIKDTDRSSATTKKKSNNNTLLYIIGGTMVIVFLVVGKKKLSGNKNKFDDDETYGGSDDFTSEEPEITVNEDEE